MLDEQIMEKELINDGIGVGSMTLQERMINGLDGTGE